MTTPWRSALETLLRSGMKYCFPTVVGKYPEINEEEFSAPDGGPGGFLHHMISFVTREREKSFKAGYLKGASDCFHDIVQEPHPETLTFSEENNIRGGDRQWQVYDGETS